MYLACALVCRIVFSVLCIGRWSTLVVKVGAPSHLDILTTEAVQQIADFV